MWRALKTLSLAAIVRLWPSRDQLRKPDLRDCGDGKLILFAAPRPVLFGAAQVAQAARCV